MKNNDSCCFTFYENSTILESSTQRASGYWWKFNEIWRAYIHPIFVIIAFLSNILNIVILPRTTIQNHLKVYYWPMAVADSSLVILRYLWLFTGPGLYFATNGAVAFYPMTQNIYVCKFITIFANMAKNFSDYTYVLLGIDRFYAVFFPLKARSSVIRSLIGCFTIVLCSACFHFTLTYYIVIIIPNSKVNYDNRDCLPDNTFKTIQVPFYLSYVISSFFFQNILHLTFVVVLNILLIQKLTTSRILRRQLLAHNQLKTQSMKHSASETNATITLLTVSVIHLLANIPNATFWIWLAALNALNPRQKANRTPIWQMVANSARTAQMFSIFDYFSNFLVYFLRIESYRQQLMFLLSYRKNSLTKTTSHTS